MGVAMKKWFRLVFILAIIGFGGFKLYQMSPNLIAPGGNSFTIFFILLFFLLITFGIYRVLTH